MSLFYAALLGIIEGVTEYLPISSTFHLIWASKLLGITQTEFQKLFEVVIQSGAILAVSVLYYKTILTEKKLVQRVLISFLPTAFIGLILYKIIKNVFFENSVIQIFVFVLVGTIFILFEKGKSGNHPQKSSDQISVKEALAIGLVQSLAVIPGVSRAGAVIVSMMVIGIKREEAAKYSFLLAIPTLLAASALDIVKYGPQILTQSANLNLLVFGFLFSFISALVIVKWFIAYLQKHSLSFFGWYRLIVAVLLLSKFINA